MGGGVGGSPAGSGCPVEEEGFKRVETGDRPERASVGAA